MNKYVIIGAIVLVAILGIAAVFVLKPSPSNQPVIPVVPQPNQPVLPSSGTTIVTPFGTYTLPTSDVNGEDLECIGRYQGLIRMMYENTSDSDGSYTKHVIYYTTGNVFDQVKEYFINQLTKCGYTKESESNTVPPQLSTDMKIEKVDDLTYTKEEYTVYLTVVSVKISGNDYTFVDISEEYYPLETGGSTSGSTTQPPTEVTPVGKAADLNSVFKPVLESIFGTVIVTDSVSNNVSGIEYVSLEYYLGKNITAEDLNTLVSSLQEQGYSVISSEVSSSEFSIVITKDNEYITMSGYLNANSIKIEEMTEIL